MNAMRPWMHESQLAIYLESQRSSLRSRTPRTPSFAASHSQTQSEDILLLDQASTALQNLRLRLTNYEELTGHVDRVIQYLQAIRRDFPLQAPEEAFGRLQPLRQLLFWMPPSILRSSESDLGPIAVLCNFSALALALEPLFPEIGGTYLGSMSVTPIEKMHEIMQLRRNANPQDPALQVAMSMLDTPLHILAVYRSRQAQAPLNVDTFKHSPQTASYVAPLMRLATTPDNATATLYSNSPMHSPANLQIPVQSYFQGMPASAGARRSSPLTPNQVMNERRLSTMSTVSTGSSMSTSHMVFPGQSQPQQYVGPEMSTGLGYYDQVAFQYGANTRFVTPSQLWA